MSYSTFENGEGLDSVRTKINAVIEGVNGIEAGAQVNTVTSVNGQTGLVVLDAEDVGAQPVDATLTAMAGVATAADRIIYFTGVDVSAAATLTAFGRSLIDAAAASAARTTLGLGTAATSTVTTSSTDTTVGRLLKTGDWGLGNLALDAINLISDESVNRARFFRQTSLSIGGWGQSSGCASFPIDSAPNTGFIAISQNSGGRAAIGVKVGATGTPMWSEIYTTNNVNNVAWTTPTLSNGWTANATYGIQYRVVMGVLYITGVITAGTKTNGTAVFTLPAGARPTVVRAQPVGSLESGADAGAHVTISTAGAVAVQNINDSHNNLVINAVVRLT